MMRNGRNTKEVVRQKAADFFFEKGFAATNLREVATASGLKIGSLYNHIASKEDLLLQVMGGVIDDLIEAQQEALTVGGDSVERLRSAVDRHIRFHAERAKEVHIGNSNLNQLSDEARAAVIEKRDRYREVLESLIIAADEDGLATALDPRLHTYSIIASGNHIAGWYKPDGRLSLDEIVQNYSKMILRELNVSDADARVDTAQMKAKPAA